MRSWPFLMTGSALSFALALPLPLFLGAGLSLTFLGGGPSLFDIGSSILGRLPEPTMMLASGPTKMGGLAIAFPRLLSKRVPRERGRQLSGFLSQSKNLDSGTAGG